MSRLQCLTKALHYNIIKYIYLINKGIILKIFVLKQGKPIGYLEENSFDQVTFQYLDDIQKEFYIPGLKEKVNHSSTGLFLVFKNMFPENNQIEKLKAKYKIGSNIELLLYLEDIHGSYSFLTEEDYVKYQESEYEIYRYKDVVGEILNNEYTFPNILDYELAIAPDKLYPEDIVNSKIIGLSGFQYKFSIIKDDEERTLVVDDSRKSEYFMKPYSQYYTTYTPREKERLYIPYLLINEHIFMTLARDIGFPVPYNAIIKDGKDYHYIIKRYDRYKNARFDHEEFATLLDYDSDTKYDATVKEILEKATEYVGKEKVEELLLFFFFSTLISHGDLHSKNVSLIHASNSIDEQEKHLAPYYDISTTFIYKGLKNKDIGLKLLNKKNKIKKEDFLTLAEHLSIDTDRFENKMKDMVDFFIHKFPNYIDALPTEIKDLPFYEGYYASHKPFKMILERYYHQRKAYIAKYIDKAWIRKDTEALFD